MTAFLRGVHVRLVRWRPERPGFLVLVLLCVVLLPILSIAAIEGRGREAVALAILFPLITLAAFHVRGAIAVTFAYLVLVGDLRRLLIPIVGWAGLDPLLLLGSVMSTLICGAAVARGAIRLDTPLARWGLGLTVVMVLQIFNPKQGGLIVGVAGCIFILTPLLWFWIGRTYATVEFVHALLYKVLLPLGLAAMIFGFVQVLSGYLPYQMTWYDIAGYTALGNPATGLSPISFFASGTEHASFLMVVGIVLWTAGLTTSRAALLLWVPILLGVLVTGIRGPMVRLLGGSAMLWAMLGQSRTSWFSRGFLAIAICAVGLVWSLSHVESLDLEGAAQARLERQAKLLEEGAEDSAVGTHLHLLVIGYQTALKEPLGLGLGFTTKAASKFGGGGHGTETDMGDVMMSTGVIGGAIYHIMAVLILLTAVRYWQRSRSPVALALLGIIGVMLLSWLGGGYALSPLTWFCIGAVDRLYHDHLKGSAADGLSTQLP